MKLYPYPDSYKTAFALGGILLGLAGFQSAQAATYTWQATGTQYWQQGNQWNPNAGATGPGAGDTIGATTAVGTLRMDANHSQSYTVESFVRSGSGTWTVESLDNGRANPTDPVRDVMLNITGNMQATSANTVFRSNTLADNSKSTLGISIGGALHASGGNLFFGNSASTILYTFESKLSSFSVSGTTTINSERTIALWVEPGNASLGRVTNNGTLQIYRASASANSTPGAVSVGTLGGSGTVMVSDHDSVNLTATLNIDGGISGNYTGTIVNGTAGNVLNLAKSGTGVQILAGNNTYSGGTVVNGGLLLAQNTSGSALGSGGVQVNAGGELGGNGIIAPTTPNEDIVIDGKLRPGFYEVETPGFVPGDLAFQAGTLTFDLASGSKLSFGAGSSLEVILGTASSSIAFASAGDWLAGSDEATLYLVLGDGFDYSETYTIFSNVTTDGFKLLNIVGFDSDAYSSVFEHVGNDYVLSFAPIPEPSTTATLIGISLLAAAFALRRRKALN